MTESRHLAGGLVGTRTISLLQSALSEHVGPSAGEVVGVATSLALSAKSKVNRGKRGCARGFVPHSGVMSGTRATEQRWCGGRGVTSAAVRSADESASLKVCASRTTSETHDDAWLLNEKSEAKWGVRPPAHFHPSATREIHIDLPDCDAEPWRCARTSFSSSWVAGGAFSFRRSLSLQSSQCMSVTLMCPLVAVSLALGSGSHTSCWVWTR